MSIAPDTALAAAESAERHEAERPPLLWSEELQKWIPAVDPDLEANVSSNAQEPVHDQNSDADESSTATSKTLEKEAKKPVRAFSEGSNGAIYINFSDEDPDNPFDWSKRRKWIITGIGPSTLRWRHSFFAN